VHGTGRSRRAAEQSAAKQAFEAAQLAIAHLGRRTRKKAAVPTAVEAAASEPATSTPDTVTTRDPA
jgi:type II secretory pathway pseudopilin PulG